MIRALLVAALPLSAAAAPDPSCSRRYDKELEILLPASVHAKLFALPGPHAKEAAAFLLAHASHTLTIGVSASKASAHPELPIMSDNAIMQFMSGRGYYLAHDLLHERPGGERRLARDPAALAELADMLLPIWAHEISHGRVHEREVRWPVSATLEDELIACHVQAAFTAELLAADPRYAGLDAVYRAQRAAAGGGPAAKRRYLSIAPTKRLIVHALEVGAASTEEFERMYRRAYGMKASLADPLTAGLRQHEARQEFARLLKRLDLPASPQKTSAEELLAYGAPDEKYWLEPEASPAAKRDAERLLAERRAELDAMRPALRRWFEAAAGAPIDWTKLAPPRDVPVGVAPPDAGP
ncbi:MAG: hypothetical protein M0D55_18115 [Elusimicrobiota bacterium]|nr:MAG: hypothetical protein M0D55_18115 [Elusimicrobiota bacterium]